MLYAQSTGTVISGRYIRAKEEAEAAAEEDRYLILRPSNGKIRVKDEEDGQIHDFKAQSTIMVTSRRTKRRKKIRQILDFKAQSTITVTLG